MKDKVDLRLQPHNLRQCCLFKCILSVVVVVCLFSAFVCFVYASCILVGVCQEEGVRSVFMGIRCVFPYQELSDNYVWI